ncbi:sigma-54 dependent transcriptional regulator [Piscinibacter sp. HJYY11]|uniref:sigma-54-dependent transcriptional regulator n=1 Tax=Piscinibacter sp. HJYY11 TaxID=2801333 RepID=UPI00191E68ED|nr:sigma-54 dependent transcriptional regulator [Piscinibacter sp. HJYY11]MBL0726638.1 sigma-54-dependent Fis family transcriptional regulator [Piscinibacter sp. HJYY11]
MSQGAAHAATVMLVEDDAVVRKACEQALSLSSIGVRAFASAEAALEEFHQVQPSVVVTDVRLPGIDGLKFLEELHGRNKDLPIIVVTGHGDVSMAVEAMRDGAYDFIEKPFSSERLVESVRRGHERYSLIAENRRLRERLPSADKSAVIGQSSAILRVRRLISALAPTDVDILLIGETGAGKEVVAKQLHDESRRTGHFVALNCGALPESVIESEIFGHEAGSFTGAHKRRIGKIEHANRGTLFLDEIESMTPAMQTRLLRVLQEREIQRLGSNESVPVDCRVIAAAKGDLKLLSDQGRFRADLYYRLNVASIEIAPLRERLDDIPLLATHFIQCAAERYRVEPPELTVEVLMRWQQHHWPGNVRELKNASERFCLGLDDGVAAARSSGYSLAARLDVLERSMISEALRNAGGNVGKAADLLQMPRKTLYDKLHRHALVPADFSTEPGKGGAR